MRTFWLVLIDNVPRMATMDKRKAEDLAERCNREMFNSEAIVIRTIEANEPKIHLRQLRSKSGLFSDIQPIDAPRVHSKITIDIPPQFSAIGLSRCDNFDLASAPEPPNNSREFRYRKTALCALHVYED
jgi:hypothetical protein